MNSLHLIQATFHPLSANFERKRSVTLMNPGAKLTGWWCYYAATDSIIFLADLLKKSLGESSILLIVNK